MSDQQQPEYLFYVTAPSRGIFVIEWDVVPPADAKKFGKLTAFLYWGKFYEATYKLMPWIRPAQTRRIPRDYKPIMELVPVEGTSGEYRDGIYWNGPHQRIYRLFSSTHYLTQHGLDGLPRLFTDSLWRWEPGKPVFRVHPYSGGVFVMTFEDWMRYFTTGRNERSLGDLATYSSTESLTGEQLHLGGS